jgi:hypothetical protein
MKHLTRKIDNIRYDMVDDYSPSMIENNCSACAFCTFISGSIITRCSYSFMEGIDRCECIDYGLNVVWKISISQLRKEKLERLKNYEDLQIF